MTISRPLRRSLIESVAQRVIAAADELSELDRAIGDGDHGINMKRGFGEVLKRLDELADEPLPKGLTDTGMTLVMKVGGAAGPLYGTLLMSLGKFLPDDPAWAELGSALDAAVEAVKIRGKSEAGQKTMLDVWIPVTGLLTSGEVSPRQIRDCAAEAVAATVPMRATRGRASFLGERSIGHVDPGARSSQIMIDAICDIWETQA